MNEEQLTPEQKENLKTWAEQRDVLLSEISILKTENEKLQSSNKDLAESNSDLENRMNVVRGRIEELKIKENEFIAMMSKNATVFQSDKTSLETEITWLKQMIEVLTTQKTSLETDVSFALGTLSVVKDEVSLLDKIVEKVTTVSSDNTFKINTLVNDLATNLADIISVNKKNVAETNIVIDKLPKMIMEAQKHGLIKNKI